MYDVIINKLINDGIDESTDLDVSTQCVNADSKE